MSTLRNPVGPKDRKVYIRRRIMVLAGLLAIIAVIVLIIVKPGSSGGAQDARDVSLPDGLAGEEQVEGDADDAEADLPTCAEQQLVVTPITDRDSYAAGEEPQLSLSVENTGEADCLIDLGTATLQFEITSGSDEVWRSSDCQVDPVHQVGVLAAGEVTELEEPISWSRERSSPETCDVANREQVPAGGASYHLHVSAGGVGGAETRQFLLN